MQALLESLVKDWPAGEPTPIQPRDPVLKEKPAPIYLGFSEAVQLQFYLAHTGIRRDHPDYAALLVMDHVLGTGPGFTDRLSARLRDREGLAYTVNASIAISADSEAGMFVAYIGTAPENLDRVNKEMREEIARIRDTLPTKDEVEDAKNYILGSMPFSYETSAALAGKLLALDRNGLGIDTPNRLRAEIAKVTPERVREVAHKHLHPESLQLIAAGPLDKDGKLLKK
jgi:zinc protease